MSINLHGIGRRSFDLIIASEVGSRAQYDHEYIHPEKPGGASGVTVGMGFDCGYYSAASIRQTWEGKIPHAMVEALASCAGIKGDAAYTACARVKGLVTIPWDAAMDVFCETSLPAYLKTTRRALLNFDLLPPECQGVLTSLVYNRGASFTLAGDRYREMRGIREAMAAKNFHAIPGLLRSMKRLWTNKSVRGVAIRREKEALLFEQALAEAGVNRMADVPEPVDAADEDPTLPYTPSPEVAPVEPAPRPDPVPEPPPPSGDEILPAAKEKATLNVQPETTPYNLETEIVQRKLIKLGYHEVGEASGKWGGKTKGALTAFLNDRGKEIFVNGGVTPEINSEISAALGEGWTRPISERRASATEKDIAPKVEAVRQNIWQRFWAKIAALGSGAGALISGASDHLDGVNEKLEPVKQFFVNTPGWVWFALAALIAANIWLLANRSIKATVTDYNTGRLN